MYQLTQISASAFRKKEIPFPDWNKFDLEKRLLTFETSRSGHDIDNADTQHRFFDHSELSRLFRQECRRLVVPSVASGTVEFFCQNPAEHIWSAQALPNRGMAA